MKRLLGGIIALFMCLPLAASAEFVGISKDDFKVHYRKQNDPLWCWASSAEMVLSYEGINLPQERIVERVKGVVVSGTGSPGEMINATNGIFTDVNGKRSVVSGQLIWGAPLPTVLYNQLKQKKPVILTYQASPQFGHAVVLTGIDAIVSDTGVQILKFYIFDPFAYRMRPNPWGGVTYDFDDSLSYKEYAPQTTPFGIAIPAGLVTGVILVNGTNP